MSSRDGGGGRKRPAANGRNEEDEEIHKKQRTSGGGDPPLAQTARERAAEIAQRLAAFQASRATPLPSQEDIQAKVAAARAALQQQQQQVQQQPAHGLPVDKVGRGGIKMGLHPLLMNGGQSGSGPQSSNTLFVPRANVATLRSNQRHMEDNRMKSSTASLAAFQQAHSLKIEKPPADFSDPTKNPYFDPNLAGASGAPKQKFPRNMRFAPRGKFIEQANQLRAEAHLEKLKEQIAATVKKAGMEAELELITDENLRREPPPETEWWDEALVQGSYDIPISYDIQAPDGEALITNLVQHPVPILPPDAGKVAPMQVMLTKKERKKLRRQRRLEALKERQDKIRLGLMPPDAPKVKIANLMRVLGTEAVQDPTQVEAQVRKQMADRQQQHESHNAAAQLTKEQKKEKKAQKLTEDISESAHVAVFRISRLTHPHFKFKVDKNAQQHNLSGTAILYHSFSLVIVEGGPKGIKFYKNLLMRRVEWTKFDEPGEEPNECVLVWEGEVKRPAFKGFRFRPIPTELMAKEFLEKHGIVAYWNAAKNYIAAGM